MTTTAAAPTTTAIQSPDTALFASKSTDLSDQLAKIQVTTDAEFSAAGELLKGALALVGQIEKDCDPPIEQAHKLHKSLLALRDKYRAPLSAAIEGLKRRMGAFLTERKRKQEEEERKLREEQRKQEEARLLAEAAEVKAATGSEEEALAVLDRPIETVAVPAAAPLPKVSGVSSAEVWKFRITDEKAIPREYLMVDEVAIGKVVRALKGKCRITGVEVYPETGIRGSKAAG